jgi:hypothetical protein
LVIVVVLIAIGVAYPFYIFNDTIRMISKHIGYRPAGPTIIARDFESLECEGVLFSSNPGRAHASAILW